MRPLPVTITATYIPTAAKQRMQLIPRKPDGPITSNNFPIINGIVISPEPEQTTNMHVIVPVKKNIV